MRLTEKKAVTGIETLFGVPVGGLVPDAEHEVLWKHAKVAARDGRLSGQEYDEDWGSPSYWGDVLRGYSTTLVAMEKEVPLKVDSIMLKEWLALKKKASTKHAAVPQTGKEALTLLQDLMSNLEIASAALKTLQGMDVMVAYTANLEKSQAWIDKLKNDTLVSEAKKWKTKTLDVQTLKTTSVHEADIASKAPDVVKQALAATNAVLIDLAALKPFYEQIKAKSFVTLIDTSSRGTTKIVKYLSDIDNRLNRPTHGSTTASHAPWEMFPGPC